MKLTSKVLFTILMIAMIISLSNKKSLSQVTDKDGNVYKTVTIGNQEWMAENLNVSHYGNGDPIPEVQDSTKWPKLTTGAWCYYQNNSDNGKTYGKLYNWYAVKDTRGLTPNGWHIPSDEEWAKLINFLGGDSVAGGKMKATTLWNSPNEGATNESGFTAYSGGYRSSFAVWGDSNNVGLCGCFWSSSKGSFDNALYRTLLFTDSIVFRDNFVKIQGLSVRCVRV